MTLCGAHLTGHGAMHVDRLPLDVVQNALVSRWGPTSIVIRLQPVDGNYDPKPQNLFPSRQDRANGSGHESDRHAHPAHLRQQGVQLPEAHQRFAAHDGEIDRADLAGQGQKSVEQRLPRNSPRDAGVQDPPGAGALRHDSPGSGAVTRA